MNYVALYKYLKSNSMTQADFAESIGVTRGYICHLLKGRRSPGRELAARIERKTGGKVPYRGWGQKKAESTAGNI